MNGSAASFRIDKEEMAAKVIEEFKHAWDGYKRFAWGHDELNPLSNSYHDWYPHESLLMTPVDAFSTMYLMDLKDEMEEAKKLIFSELSFNKNIEVQHFEISIRLLGGLLSSYQLDGDERFLNLAEDLATRMLPVWESDTGMPFRMVNLKNKHVSVRITYPAEIGTYLPEYKTLSTLTGNPVFGEKAERAMESLYERRSAIDLVGGEIDIKTGKWRDTDSHIGAGIDSYYEYCLKSYLITGDEKYNEMYAKHKRAMDKYYVHEVKTGYWYSVVDMNSGARISTIYGALEAFYAGILCLAGDVEQAKRLQDSNFNMWKLNDIEAESINYMTMEIGPAYYMLRPENIESAFYLYRFTGEEKYLEMGVEYYRSLKEHCKTENGYARLKNVKTKEQEDRMDSFFLAETLKYLYLMFAPEDKFNFDTHIFNTEAQPLKKLNLGN